MINKRIKGKTLILFLEIWYNFINATNFMSIATSSWFTIEANIYIISL